jgi:hypothetical protein
LGDYFRLTLGAETSAPDGVGTSLGYNLFMARGWESKAVEEQQAEARAATSASKARLTPEQAAKQKQQQQLLLSRNHVLQQLGAAQNPLHRKMLEVALNELDAQLARLG